MTNEPGTAWLPAPVIGFSTLSRSCFTHLVTVASLVNWLCFLSLLERLFPPPPLKSLVSLYSVFMSSWILQRSAFASWPALLWVYGAHSKKQNSCKKQFFDFDFFDVHWHKLAHSSWHPAQIVIYYSRKYIVCLQCTNTQYTLVIKLVSAAASLSK